MQVDLGKHSLLWFEKLVAQVWIIFDDPIPGRLRLDNNGPRFGVLANRRI
jgi:hypothetical protein